MIETANGGVHIRPGTVSDPDATLGGAPPLVVGLLSGEIDLATALAGGLEFEGDREALRRVQPAALAGV